MSPRFLLLCALCWCVPVVAQEQAGIKSEEERFRVVVMTRGLEHPWCVAFLPDGRMLVTERPGRLRVVGADGALMPQPVEGIPEVVTGGQAGLFDVALHPRYAQNGLVYLSYAERGEGGASTALMRARLVESPGKFRLEDRRVIFSMRPKTRTAIHFGGRIVFDREGYVYLTLGERGEQERAQKFDDHAGSTIRLHDDGRVPEDNPFLNIRNAKPEKFTRGQRNVQGAALHPRTGAVWTHEHGPQGGDEINILEAGANYGWPVVTYGVNYGIGTKIGEGATKSGIAAPLYYWVPSIAPSGMAFYAGDKFPRWRGDLFVGALKDQMLVRLQLQDNRVVKEERLLSNGLGRIRDVRSGPDGYLYLLTDAEEGVLARLEPL
ncbi:MAG TPA: PQQ-dependent sugar dehydrogenase [Burkholderiales bacterium]|nr:PQQ-dependent sugar dehydrogenase [Burkholderiales bacterium]